MREAPWTCPRCKRIYMVIPELFKTSDHLCNDLAPPITSYYFYRLKDDNFVQEFCVTNASDPDQIMVSWTKEKIEQIWDKRWEGDLLVFKAPDGYDGGPVGWKYDRRKQLGEAAPRHLLERYALHNRKSFDMKKVA